MLRALHSPLTAGGTVALLFGLALGAGFLTGHAGWLTLLGLLGVVVALLVLIRPEVGLYLFAGTIPLEMALMFEGASAPRLIGLLVFGSWGLQKLGRGESFRHILAAPLFWSATLLLCLALASILWAVELYGTGRALFLLLQLILLLVLVLDLAPDGDRLTWLARLLVLSASVAAAVTLSQYFGGEVRRAGHGVVGGINRTSVTLVAVVPFAFYLLRVHQALLWRLLGLLYLVLVTGAVAVTLTRMNYLVLPLVFAAHLPLLLRNSRDRVIAVAFVGLVGLAFVVNPPDPVIERAGSIVPYLEGTFRGGQEGPYSERGFHLRLGWEVFRDHPVLGAGFQSYRPLFLTYQWETPGAPMLWTNPRSPHSSHVGMLANLGIVGFFLWMSLFVLAMTSAGRAWRRAQLTGEVRMHYMAQAVFIALCLQGVYGFYAEVDQTKLLWTVLGMAAALDRFTHSSVSSRAGLKESRTAEV